MPVARLHDIWRKNSPELMGIFSGGMPGFTWRVRTAPLPRGAIPVFGYHCVETDVFEADLQFIVRNGYTTLHPDGLVARMNGEVESGEREIVLTFDDGPRNFFDVALPLLEKYGVNATAFVAPGLMADDYGSAQASLYRPMTWSEVRACQASGRVSIQSHTWASRYVPAWPRDVPLAGVDPVIEARLREHLQILPLAEDLAHSQKSIAANCPGAVVRHLCFPQYHGSDEAVEVAQRLGFTGLFWGLLRAQPWAAAGGNAAHIPRLLGEFVRRLPGAGRIGLGDVLALRRRSMLLGRRMRRAWQA